MSYPSDLILTWSTTSNQWKHLEYICHVQSNSHNIDLHIGIYESYGDFPSSCWCADGHLGNSTHDQINLKIINVTETGHVFNRPKSYVIILQSALHEYEHLRFTFSRDQFIQLRTSATCHWIPSRSNHGQLDDGSGNMIIGSKTLSEKSIC